MLAEATLIETSTVNTTASPATTTIARYFKALTSFLWILWLDRPRPTARHDDCDLPDVLEKPRRPSPLLFGTDHPGDSVSRAQLSPLTAGE